MAVELNPIHFRFIQTMCRNLELEQVTAIRGDVIRFLKKPFQSFDLIFADPPYDHPLLDQLPSQVLSTELLRPGGMFILEHPASISFAATPQFTEIRKYGGVNFSFFKQQDT
jgi:16S rRNA (guanine966-N2)-methyltransferase